MTPLPISPFDSIWTTEGPTAFATCSGEPIGAFDAPDDPPAVVVGPTVVSSGEVATVVGAVVEVDEDDEPPDSTTPVTPPITARATTAAMIRDRVERFPAGPELCATEPSAIGGGSGTPSGGLGGMSRHVRGRGSGADG